MCEQEEDGGDEVVKQNLTVFGSYKLFNKKKKNTSYLRRSNNKKKNTPTK